jgi:hypothetical protein
MRLYPLVFLLIAACLVVRASCNRGAKIVSGARRAVQKNVEQHQSRQPARKTGSERHPEESPRRATIEQEVKPGR